MASLIFLAMEDPINTFLGKSEEKSDDDFSSKSTLIKVHNKPIVSYYVANTTTTDSCIR